MPASVAEMSQRLTAALPGFMSAVGHADMTGNVMLADDLSPISAALDAYDRAVAMRERGSTMQDVTATSAMRASNQRKPRKSADDQIGLHLCYGEIGISAVAAAARYQSGAKNPGGPPAAIELDERGAAVA
jgi:hypothetical protein